ncbi:hypothetical protein L9F63_013628 [Diploptera punctata]|uniref:Uncharacterized protein n=1 Tax=Diploptera punctata TaxID=6984 RepID=A0AAD8ELW5_DIPPU|nr:hypothetical protein L9F63_013628 [Diploptera punctata]
MEEDASSICITRTFSLPSLVCENSDGQQIEDNLCGFIVRELIMELLDRVINIAIGTTSIENPRPVITLYSHPQWITTTSCNNVSSSNESKPYPYEGGQPSTTLQLEESVTQVHQLISREESFSEQKT